MSKRAHVVFTHGRSGSNYVSNLLNAHPAVTNYGEVMGEHSPAFKLHQRLHLWGSSVEEHLDRVLTSRSYFELAQAYSATAHLRRRQRPNYKRWKNIQQVGFKEFGIRFDRQGISSYLLDRPEVLVVSLIRENTLDRVVSVFRMEQTGEVAASASHTATAASIEVPVDHVMSALEVYEGEKVKQLGQVRELPTHRVLHISYEELFASTSAQEKYRADLFDFLGVSALDVESSHRRISDRPMSERVSNYPEIRDAVIGTPYERYLPS